VSAPPRSGDDPRLRVARLFMRAGRPLGASLLFTELARAHHDTPEVWCGLGAALLGARTPLRVKPFERWAAYVLRHAEPIVYGTPFAQPRLDLEQGLAPPPTDDAMDAYFLDQLAEFLHDSGDPLVEGIDGLGPDERTFAVAALADTSAHALPVVRTAILGRWRAGVARTALRHCERHLDRPEIRAAITAATRSPHRDKLEPFLGHAVDRLR
jgi:hypothetical protein